MKTNIVVKPATMSKICKIVEDHLIKVEEVNQDHLVSILSKTVDAWEEDDSITNGLKIAAACGLAWLYAEDALQMIQEEPAYRKSVSVN